MITDDEEPRRVTPPTKEEIRRLERAQTIRELLPQCQPIRSVRVEAVELLGPARIGELVPRVTMVINEGTPTEVRFDTAELSNGLVMLLTFEARDALQRRFARPLDPHAAMPERCNACGMGPAHRRRKTIG